MWDLGGNEEKDLVTMEILNVEEGYLIQSLNISIGGLCLNAWNTYIVHLFWGENKVEICSIKVAFSTPHYGRIPILDV